jgi:hypothetical protein
MNNADTPRAPLTDIHDDLGFLGLALTHCVHAEPSTLPAKPQARSEASQSVQSKVEKQTEDATAERRKKLFADATGALAETKKALKALENKKSDEH